MTRAAPPSCTGYERIARLTGEMLAAARHQQWDQLIELEHACKNAFTDLVEVSGAAQATPEVAQRKAALIRQVLADDAEIRSLVEPWIAELGQWLGPANHSQRLRDAYADH